MSVINGKIIIIDSASLIDMFDGKLSLKGHYNAESGQVYFKFSKYSFTNNTMLKTAIEMSEEFMANVVKKEAA